MLLQFGYILSDFMGIVADPSNMSQYILDMFHRIMALLMEAIEFFETLILNLPGIKDLCPIIAMIINDILIPVVKNCINPIVGVLNGIIGILRKLGAHLKQLPSVSVPSPIQCNIQGQSPRPYEATPCSTINDCVGATAYCFIHHPNECAEGGAPGQWNYMTGGYKPAEEWVMPCLCTQTAGSNFFCN